MKITEISGHVEKWFDLPGDCGVSVLLRLPKRSELVAASKGYTKRVGRDDEIDPGKFREFIARSLILDAKGIVDTKDGNDVPVAYSAEVGLFLLDDVRFGPFIEGILFQAADWFDAKNA